MTQAAGTYAYHAYMETLLNYGPAAKESQLMAAMFCKDTPGKMDVADPTIAVAANANHGLRYAFNQESGVIEMAGLQFCDMFKSERLLLSFVDLKVILNRNINAFCIMSDIDDAAHKVKLTEAYLKVHKVKVSPSVSITSVSIVECKTFIIPAGNPSLRKDNLYNGLVPKTFVFGMVDSAAFNGDYEKNPFNCKTFTTSFIGITVNGEEVPFKPLQLSYTAATIQYIEACLSMFSGTEKLFYDTGNDISQDDLKNGYTLYAADLTPDMCRSSDHFNVVQRGNLATITEAEHEHRSNRVCVRTRS